MTTQNFLAAVTGGYSVMASTPIAGKTYKKLAIFFPGSGEVGDGSAAQLELLANHGPLAPYRAGVTWFDDNGVIVVGVQPPSTVNYGTAQTTVKWLQNHFGIAAANTYVSGLSLGGGVGANYINRLGGIAGALLVEPASYGPATLPNWSACKLAIFTNWDDNVAASSWALGAPDGGAVTFQDANGKNQGWLQSITGICPLDNHPEHPTAIAHGGGPKFTAITVQRTALWNNGAWTWVNGIDFTSPATHRVVFSPSGGHAGWDAVFGVDAASFQPTIMATWLDIAVQQAQVDPCADVSAQLAAAQAALVTANGIATSATALATSAQAALAAEKAAHATDVANAQQTIAAATAQISADAVTLANTQAALDAANAQIASLQADAATNLTIKTNLANSLSAAQDQVTLVTGQRDQAQATAATLTANAAAVKSFLSQAIATLG